MHSRKASRVEPSLLLTPSPRRSSHPPLAPHRFPPPLAPFSQTAVSPTLTHLAPAAGNETSYYKGLTHSVEEAVNR